MIPSGRGLMDPDQVRLPYSMPDAVCISDPPRRLSPRRARSINTRHSPWYILRWLLLDADDPFVRRRCDERALDGPARVSRAFGKGHSLGPTCSPRGRNLRFGRRMVIVNGNVLTAWKPAGSP